MKKQGGTNSVTKLFKKTQLPLRGRRALTLLEMIIALAILGIIFAAILPQFRAIFNSWDSKQASAEILQNSRVLIDHLNNNLSRALRITAVSPAAQTNGYIEFKDAADVTQRYDVAAASSYVQFGEVGSLSELAGPVSQLQFTCYDACDLSTPITDVTKIRYVNVASTFSNPAAMGQSKTFSTQAYLRANYQSDDVDWGLGSAEDPWLEYDTLQGQMPALGQIDSSHYLCVYNGDGDDGWAVVLQVNADWSITKKTPFEFDASDAQTPSMVQIDATHYLCAYTGTGDDGWACVLTVDTGTWNISKSSSFEFDTSDGMEPALAKIDDTHYLCAYRGSSDDGWAVVLNVASGSYAISGNTAFEFDTSNGQEPALVQIDGTHYLCTYRGPNDDGWACVLAINTGTWAISKSSSFEFDTQNGQNSDLLKIDGTHYLCAYTGQGSDGWAVILIVNSGTYAISKGTPCEFDSQNGEMPAMSWVNSNCYVCTYVTNGSKGQSIALLVSTNNWNIVTAQSYQYESNQQTQSSLARIDDNHCLAVYSGHQSDGFAGVLRVNVLILP